MIRDSKNIFKLVTKLTMGVVVAVFVISATQPYTYYQGELFGLAAALLFIISQLPGIIRRFGFNDTISKVINQHVQFARAQIGILMYMTALSHYLLVFVIPNIRLGVTPVFTPLEIIGFFALNIALLLFLTSNIQSRKFMGVWWKRLHSLAYVMTWLIFAHVGLVAMEFDGPRSAAGLVAILLLIVGVLQGMSLLKERIEKKLNT